MSRPIALVTGASSGIGRELARQLAAKGYDLFVVARRLERLTDLAEDVRREYGATAWPIQMDLCEPDAPQRIVDAVASAGKQLDVLVNDAGLGHAGPFASMPASDIEEQLKVNMFALTNLTRLVLPTMVARKQGKILNVGSIAGFLPGPGMAMYYATKAFVISFSEALWQEVRGTGVTVTCLCPGLTHSEFHSVSHMRSGRFGWMTSEHVATIGLRAMMQGKRLIVAGGLNTFIAWAVKFVPRRVLLVAGNVVRSR